MNYMNIVFIALIFICGLFTSSKIQSIILSQIHRNNSGQQNIHNFNYIEFDFVNIPNELNVTTIKNGLEQLEKSKDASKHDDFYKSVFDEFDENRDGLLNLNQFLYH